LLKDLPADHQPNFRQTVITRDNPSGGAPIKSPADLHVTYEQQLTIVSACLRNLQHAAAGHARRLDLKPALPANDPQGTCADFGRPAVTGATA